MASADSAAARAFHEAPLPGGRTPWREVTFSVIDLETTGLDPSTDEIISFATVTVAGGRVRLHDARYELVRPSRMPDAETIRIHGLREADLSDAPPISDSHQGLNVRRTNAYGAASGADNGKFLPVDQGPDGRGL